MYLGTISAAEPRAEKLRAARTAPSPYLYLDARCYCDTEEIENLKERAERKDGAHFAFPDIVICI